MVEGIAELGGMGWDGRGLCVIHGLGLDRGLCMGIW